MRRPCEWRENLKMRKTRKTRNVTNAPEIHKRKDLKLIVSLLARSLILSSLLIYWSDMVAQWKEEIEMNGTNEIVVVVLFQRTFLFIRFEKQKDDYMLPDFLNGF